MSAVPLPQERLQYIKRRIETDGRVSATDLAREFSTSEDTIRRDLRDLAAAGLCRRIYGGALRVSPTSTPIRERLDHQPRAKAALARAAVGHIRAGQTIFIDTGSTNRALAEALPGDLSVTVVTNAPAIAAVLAERPGCTLVMIGGRVDPHTGGCFGAKALRDLDDIRPDLCCIGACAVSRHGLAVFDADEAAFKHRLLERSTEVLVMATNDKLGTSAPFGFAPLAAVDVLVLESDAVFEDGDPPAGLRIVQAAASIENAR